MIAKASGLSQATVSLALRNSPAISSTTRQRIQRIAAELGYQPHAYISTLMSHIRSGHVPSERGCIAILSSANPSPTANKVITLPTYELQRKGMIERALKIGFTTEIFYWNPQHMSMARLDQIFQARRIAGIVLAPTGLREDELHTLSLPDYALSTIAYTLPNLMVDRVSTHHRHNVHLAYEKLQAHGYKRIGFVLPPIAVEGVDLNWQAGFLVENARLSPARRIPLFVGKPGEAPFARFRNWFRRWKPDVILGLVGHEIQWLEALKLRVPEDVGLACLNRLPDSHFCGVEEQHEIIGATALNLVAEQIIHNEHGFRQTPRLILIDGKWTDGETLRKQPRRTSALRAG